MKQLKNTERLPKDTFNWLKAIGACDMSDFPFYIPSVGMFYSSEYLRKTPLEELKIKHQNTLDRKNRTAKNKPCTQNKLSVAEIVIVALVSLIISILMVMILG